MFFLRITEWGWEDAPASADLFGDVPKRSEPLPRFLDDGEYARFMRALAAEPHLHRAYFDGGSFVQDNDDVGVADRGSGRRPVL